MQNTKPTILDIFYEMANFYNLNVVVTDDCYITGYLRNSILNSPLIVYRKWRIYKGYSEELEILNEWIIILDNKLGSSNGLYFRDKDCDNSISYYSIYKSYPNGIKSIIDNSINDINTKIKIIRERMVENKLKEIDKDF